MLDIINPIAFFLSGFGLVGWHYFQEKPVWSLRMSKLFLGALLVYIFSLAFAPPDLSGKLWILFRDFSLLAFLTVLLNRLRGLSGVFAGVLLITTIGFWLVYRPIMVHSLQGLPALEPVKLDPSGELLVEMKDGYEIAEMEALAQRLGATLTTAFSPANSSSTDLDNYLVLDIPETTMENIDRIKEALAQAESVESFEENEFIQVHPMESGSNHPGLTNDFGVNDPQVGEQWGLQLMEVDKLFQLFASGIAGPSKKALLAILDTGVDAKHEDLSDRFQSVNPSYDDDPRGHGTHCAGIAAAITNNGKGIASFSPNTDYLEVTSIKVLGPNGGGSQASIIRGMIEAADRGADVISMSLGGFSRDKKQRAYSRAVRYANDAGAIVVCAAGNNGGDARLVAPANVPGVITVSALDPEGNKAVFSNYVDHIDMAVAAPGQDILSTIPGDQYARYSGTSMATPYVAGLIGLLKSIRPSLTTREVFSIMKKTGKNTGTPAQTGQLIIPYKALMELQ